MKLRKPCFLVWLCVLGSAICLAEDKPPAAAASPTKVEADYGEMYVVQTRETKPGLWQGSLGYSYGFSNPYVNIHGVDLSFSRRFGSFFALGVAPSFYFTTQKDVVNGLSQNLGAQGISTSVDKPVYSGYATAKLIPLSGMLNWFSTSALDFDFMIELGLGAVSYSGENFLIPSGRVMIGPELMLTKGFGLSGGLESIYDIFPGVNAQNRVSAVFSLVGRL